MLCGVMLSLAAGSKNQTFISIGLLGLWLVLREAWPQQLAGARGRDGVRAGTLMAMLPYYLYQRGRHRNPLYPVFAGPLHGLLGATPPAQRAWHRGLLPDGQRLLCNCGMRRWGIPTPAYGDDRRAVFLMAIRRGAARRAAANAARSCLRWCSRRSVPRHRRCSTSAGPILLSGVTIALHHIGRRSGWRQQAILGV